MIPEDNLRRFEEVYAQRIRNSSELTDFLELIETHDLIELVEELRSHVVQGSRAGNLEKLTLLTSELVLRRTRINNGQGKNSLLKRMKQWLTK